MDLRPGNTEALVGRRRDSAEMMPVPKSDPDIVAQLQSIHPKWLIHVESNLRDRARLEHSLWCHALDWHVSTYNYWVHDASESVYIAVKMEGE